MYNGGITFEGDEALARAALPEALQLANMVRGLKTSAGLDRIEKVYDIDGGGTIRVVDNDYVRHLYINVPPIELPISEEELEDRKLLDTSTYAVFPPYGASGFPTTGDNPAVDSDAVGLTPLLEGGAGTGGTLQADKNLLQDVYGYEAGSFAGRKVESEIDWLSSQNVRLYTPASGTTSKYNLYNESPTGIHCKGHSVISTTNALCGFGIYEDHIVWMTFVGYGTYTGHDDYPPGLPESRPTRQVSIWARKITYEGVGGIPTLDAGEATYLVGTFNQDPADYGVPAIDLGDGVFDEGRHCAAMGSVWFNFSGDGDKAVRARCFVTSETVLDTISEGNTITTKSQNYYTYRDEITLSLVADSIAFSRETDSAGAISADEIYTEAYTSVISTPAPGGSTGADLQTAITNGTWSMDSALAPCAAAYDYNVAGDLVSLAIEYTSLLLSGTIYLYSRLAGHEYGVEGERETTHEISASLSSRLIYSDGSISKVVPYYSVSLAVSATATNEQEPTLPASPEPGGSYSWRHADRSASCSSSSMFSASPAPVLAPNVSGVSALDLRNGVFIITALAASETSSGSDSISSSGWHVGTPGFPSKALDCFYALEASVNTTRTDTLYVASGNIMEAIPLPQISSLNHSGTPSYAHNSGTVTAAETFNQSDIMSDKDYSFSVSTRDMPAIIRYLGRLRPIGSGGAIINMPLISDAGGSIAVDPGISILISVFGAELSVAAGETADFWGTYRASGQKNQYPACKQATYLYTYADGQVTPLTEELWDSVEMDPPVYPYTTAQEQYGQAGIIEAVANNE